MKSLIERQGAKATVAPSMREIPLDQNPAVFHFAGELLAGRLDVVVFMTGVGARALLEIVETQTPREKLFAALVPCVVAVRGPKPTVVLREWGVRIDLRAPEPNTWRDLLATLETADAVRAKRIAVQEYGKSNPDFYAALEAGAATVLPVPVYRWDLPEDTGPLRAAIMATIDRQFDVLMLTSAQQLHNVLAIAREMQLEDQWKEAALACHIASIGPTATETILGEGLRVDLEPSHPKMGTLVRETIEKFGRAVK